MAKEPKQPDKEDAMATSNPVGDEKVIDYSKAELQYHTGVMRLVRGAYEKREKEWTEFNDMGYTEKTDREEKLDLAYVPPAKDDTDIRIKSGLTREKTTTAVAVAQSYNFAAKVMAFNKDDTILKELGDASSDLIYKADKMENWQNNRSSTYRGICAHGTFFTMETQDFPMHNVKSKVSLNKIGNLDVDWDDRPRRKNVNFRTVELDPRMVLVGDIYEPRIEKQPFIAISRIMSEAEAKTMFGDWDRWEYVPKRSGVVTYPDGTDAFTQYRENFSVTGDMEEGEILVTYFMRSLPYGNELAIYLNGVAMLPIMEKGQNEDGQYKVSGFPLTSWAQSGEYPIADGHLERIPNFFYSKGFPSKTQFDQESLDFFWKFLVEKANRSIKPPLGNNSGIQITPDMLQPGNVIPDIRANTLFSLLPEQMIQGISSGEASFVQMLKREIDEKTMTREFSGETVNQYQSAKQFTENKKAQLLKLGALTDGIIRYEMRRAEIRLRNSIIPYWYSRYDYDGKMKGSKSQKVANGVADVYKSFTVERENSSGPYDSNIKLGKFEDFNGFDVMSKEDREEKDKGKKVRYTYLNPDEYDFMRTLFYFSVKPEERDVDAIQRQLADNDIATAINMFGPQAIDMEKAKQRFAKSRDDVYDDWFTPTDGDMGMIPQGGEQGATLPNPFNGGGGANNQVGISGGMNPASATPPSSVALQQ